MSPRSIEVTWDPPVANIDNVTGYVISYDGVESFAIDNSVTVNRTTTSVTISGLEEFVNYDVMVEAVYDIVTLSSNTVRVVTWSAGKDKDAR